MMKHFKLPAKFLMATMTALAFAFTPTSIFAQTKSVAVTAIVEHPSLDAARDGVYEALREAGYVEGQNLRWQFQSAQGNTSIAAQIARKFIGDKPDVIIAISTPSAQTLIAGTKKIPIIFCAVTDPVSAKLTKSWQANGTNVTGVSDMLNLDKQIDLILRIVPNAKNVGMVYNPSEANSVAVIKSMEDLLSKRGMKLITAAAPRSVDVGSAGRSLVGKVDVLYSNTDNNIVSAYEALVKVAQSAKVPLVASDPLSVTRGGIAALGVDYKNLGRQAGQIAVRILQGENIGDIPVQTSEKIELYVNPAAAQKQGVTLPPDLIKEATKVIE